MTGTVVTHKTQVGQSGTAANNFTIRTLDDGSLRISRGNAGAEIADVLVIDANGNFSTAPVLGVGQTWQDVTASRVLGTTYTNTTGKPIQVAVRASSTATASVVVTVNGVAVPSFIHPASNTLAGQTVVIPTGATYSATLSAGAGTLINWLEMR